MNKVLWTDAELEIIRNNFCKLTIFELQKFNNNKCKKNSTLI